ncbi:hypothetical protein SDC9_140027 [bioreactor metagenome]|uniref:Uncharacterized protein n=1 Tax=bioreactor metagenome TaxID=1076179 RepID=A0A645DU94_9ZZZZ
MEIAIAQVRQPRGRALGRAVACVDQHHARGGAGHQTRHVDLQAAVGRGDGKERMAFAKLARFAHVEQGGFGGAVEPVTRGGCGDVVEMCGGHEDGCSELAVVWRQYLNIAACAPWRQKDFALAHVGNECLAGAVVNFFSGFLQDRAATPAQRALHARDHGESTICGCLGGTVSMQRDVGAATSPENSEISRTTMHRQSSQRKGLQP